MNKIIEMNKKDFFDLNVLGIVRNYTQNDKEFINKQNDIVNKCEKINSYKLIDCIEVVGNIKKQTISKINKIISKNKISVIIFCYEDSMVDIMSEEFNLYVNQYE